VEDARHWLTARRQRIQRFADELKAVGYSSHPTTVVLSKTADGIEIGFTVKESAWSEPAMVNNFKIMAKHLASTVFPGERAVMKLYDSKMNPQKTVPLDEK